MFISFPLFSVVWFGFISFCTALSDLIYVFVENIDLYIVRFLEKKEEKTTNKTKPEKKGHSVLRSGLLMDAWTLAHGSAIKTLPETHLAQTHAHTCRTHPGKEFSPFIFLSFIHAAQIKDLH